MGQQAGFSINGFGEASSAYFNKDVTNLTLAESAFLAGLIRSPNRYNPYTKIETATARRNQVLGLDGRSRRDYAGRGQGRKGHRFKWFLHEAGSTFQMRPTSPITFRTSSAT